MTVANNVHIYLKQLLCSRLNDVARILIKDLLEKLDGLEWCHNNSTNATDLNEGLENARARHASIEDFITMLGNEGLGSWWALRGAYARRGCDKG